MILSGRGNSKEKKRDIGGKGYEVKGSTLGEAYKDSRGKPYPYHLIHCDRSSNVYG
jgi:hypothetical protein